MKYNNAKVVKHINGETYKFDSKAEYNYFLYLKDLLEKGTIKNLIHQPSFVVADSFSILTTKTKSGKAKIGAMKYTPDFSYTLGDELIVVEVKGKVTTDYTMRKKLFLAVAYQKYNISQFVEVFANEEIIYNCESAR